MSKYLAGTKRIIGDVYVALNLDGRVNVNGKRTVRIRVQHKGISRMYSTHCTMTETEYLNFLKGKYSNQYDCANILDVFDNFCTRIKAMNENDDFSFMHLNRLMGIGKTQRNTLQSLILLRTKELEERKQIGTAITYRDLLSCINKFMEGEDVPLSSLTKTWCESFIDFMKKRGNNDTTISIRTRALSAILNVAVDQYIIKNNPLKKITIPTWNRKEVEVTNDVLETLIRVSADQIDLKDYIWLQYWKALLYGNGMDLTDLLHLRWSDMKGNMITFQRRKMIKRTKRDIKIFIRPELNQCITDIMKFKGGGKDYILMDLDDIEPNSYEEKKRITQTGRNINNALQRICRLMDIKTKITVHSARHLFATKTLQSGAPIEYVSFAMGHSDIRTTVNYMQGYTDDQIRNFAEMMSQYIRN